MRLTIQGCPGFYADAIWDHEAQVYYSQSNIDGLHLEAPTIEDFRLMLDDIAPELIRTNH